MSDAIQFETPENVQIAYRPAGLGTRFMAWAVDQILVTLAMVVAFVAFIFIAAAFDGVRETLSDAFEAIDPAADGDFNPEQAGMFFIGLIFLAMGFGGFAYFGLCELLMRGQTYGKRSAKIRVVKADGFSLDASSIFLRNLFRVIDQLPLLWVVPVYSPRGQRFGDMVSGTLVVADGDAELPPLRAMLANRTAADAQFRFDANALRQLRPQDVVAVERLLERWSDLSPDDCQAMTSAVVPPLADRLGVEPPANDSLQQQRRYLEDLLAAEYRRRNRSM